MTERADNAIEDAPAAKPAANYRTVSRVVDTLETVVAAGHPLRLTALARSLGMPVSSTQALLRELERCRMLTVSEDKEYSVGHRLVALGVKVMTGLDIATHARGPMLKLAQETGEHVYLALPEGDKILYADRADASTPTPRVDIPLGVGRPVFATAAGQVYLSSHSPEQVRKIISTLPLTAETQNTIVDPVELERRIDEVRERGYVVTNEEAIIGVVGTAAMIRDAGGGFAGALTISALRGRRTLPQEVVVEKLLATCEDISRSLGWEGP